MNNLYYFLTSIISYIGLISGYILMLVAPEEKKPGMKYFTWINYFLFVSIILLLIILGDFASYLIGFGIIALLLFFYLKPYQIYIAYLIFSLVFFISSEKYLGIFAVIIFAFGLSAGAILNDLKKKSFLRILFLIYFVVITNLLKIIL